MDLIDAVPRFEDKSAAEHTYNAIAAIGRLNDEGNQLFGTDPERRKRWKRGCDNLQAHVNKLGDRASKDLTSVLSDFVHDFEHDSERMNQMLKGVDESQNSGASREEVMAWMSFTYQLSTYAILASHIPQHHSSQSVQINVDLDTGATTEKWSFVTHTVPRMFRSFRKKIR